MPGPAPTNSNAASFWPENEHCQVLNIWTQKLDPQTKKPVMVWFHGGQFTSGSSMDSFAYEGKNLSEFGDVVVVSMNHRLNILGTLDLIVFLSAQKIAFAGDIIINLPNREHPVITSRRTGRPEVG